MTKRTDLRDPRVYREDQYSWGKSRRHRNDRETIVEGLADTTADNIPEPGTRIELVHTNDPHTRLRPGAQGTTGRYSALGGLTVAWDDGSRLSLLPDEGDTWRIL